MYVDESGDIGTKGSNNQFFCLCGLIVHELRWFQILNSFLELKRYLRQTTSLKVREEIHASHFINKPGDLFRIKRNIRLDILRQVINWASSQEDLSVIGIVCDKSKRIETNDVFEITWNRLIQRFENTISRNNFNGPRNPDERGIILPDNTDGEKLIKLTRKMRRFNPIPSQFGENQTRRLELTSIIEDPFLKDSEHSFFLQICDVIAYFLRQMYEPNSYIKKKGVKNYYQRLEPILMKKASTKHHLGIVEI